MGYYIDRSKGQDHIYHALCKKRGEIGLKQMNMAERIELQCMEIGKKKEAQQAKKESHSRFLAERDKAKQLEEELAELKQQQAFHEAVEKAVAERMSTDTTEPTEPAETPVETE